MLSFPVVFVSSARESDRNRINMAKSSDFSIEDSNSDTETDREEPAEKIVRKNKTDSRSCLGLDGTLSNILAMQLAYPEEVTPCYKFRPSDDLLESLKKAASSYNREHK